MGDRSVVAQLVVQELVDRVGREFLLVQERGPVLGTLDVVVADIDADRAQVGHLDRAAVREVALEVGGVDDRAGNRAAHAERNDDPVMAGSAPAPGFPAVAHVLAAPRDEQPVIGPVMGVGIGDDPAAGESRREIDVAALDAGRVEIGGAEHPQPRDPAVGMDMEAQVAPHIVVGAGQEVVRVRVEMLHPDQFRPRRVVVGVTVGPAGLDPALGRVVAGEVGRIHVEAVDRPRHRQRDHRVVVSAAAPAPGLPAIHPLAVIVILVGDEDRA